MYESLILIDPDADITTEALAAELRRFYGDDEERPEINVYGESIALSWPEYRLMVHRSMEAHVAIESRELAQLGGGRSDRIALCHTRFETSGEVDTEMEHFNDYLYVGEAAERLGIVFRFDQSSGEFVE